MVSVLPSLSVGALTTRGHSTHPSFLEPEKALSVKRTQPNINKGGILRYGQVVKGQVPKAITQIAHTRPQTG
jgi:hypothetical protein